MARENSRKVVRYIEETTWNTTPENPELKPLFYLPNGFSLDMVPTYRDSESHRGRIGIEGIYLVGEDSAVSLQQELRMGESNPFIRGAMRSSGIQYLSTSALPDNITSTAVSGDTFTITLAAGDGTTGNTDWVNDMDVAVGTWIWLGTAGDTCGCLGVWKVTAISTTSDTNDTVTVTGMDLTGVTATETAANVLIGVCYYQNTWAQPSFTFEVEDEDASSDQYQHGKGLVVDSVTFNQDARGVLMASFAMSGGGYANSGVTIGTGSRSNIYTTAVPLHANGAALHVQIAGSALTETETQFSLTISNATKPTPGAGTVPVAMAQGRQTITGYVDYLAQDFSLESYGLTEATSSLLIYYGDASIKPFIFTAEKVQFGQIQPQTKMDPDGYYLARIPFTAVMPATGTILATIDMPGSDTK